MKKQYDIIVIGSGLGGLTAGAELASKGKRVLILEQHFQVGGSATSFKRKGFTYEAGLHMTAAVDKGSNDYEFFKKCGLGDKVKFVPVPEFYHFVGHDYSYTFSNDVEDNIKRLGEMFPEDAKGVKKYFKTIFSIHDQAMAVNELEGVKFFFSLLISPILFPQVLSSMFSTIGKFLDRTIKDERLKAILLANIGYYGDNAHELSFLFYAIAQTGFYRKGGSYIQGGSHQLPYAMAEYIEKNNGEILTSQQVTKIIMENGKAIGVEYISKKKDAIKSKAYAPVIIANTAIPNVTDELIEGKDALPLKKKYGKLNIAPSIMTVYIALDKPLKEMGNSYYSLNYYEAKDFKIKDMPEINHADFTIRPYILCDYSQVDSRLAPDGKGYLVLPWWIILKIGKICLKKNIKQKKKEPARSCLNGYARISRRCVTMLNTSKWQQPEQ